MSLGFSRLGILIPRRTATSAVRGELDTRAYRWVKVPNADTDLGYGHLQLTHADFHSNWHYTIRPRRRVASCV